LRRFRCRWILFCFVLIGHLLHLHSFCAEAGSSEQFENKTSAAEAVIMLRMCGTAKAVP